MSLALDKSRVQTWTSIYLENIYMKSSELGGNGFILSKATVLRYTAEKEWESGTDQLCCGWLSWEVERLMRPFQRKRGKGGEAEGEVVTKRHAWSQ